MSLPERRYSCRTCEAFIFSAGGEVSRMPDGEPEPRGSSPTPCVTCPKVPRWARNTLDVKGCRSKADELSDENRAAWDFYFANRHAPPDDELFRWYSGIIERVQDEHAADTAAANYKATGATLEALITLTLRKR